MFNISNCFYLIIIGIFILFVACNPNANLKILSKKQKNSLANEIEILYELKNFEKCKTLYMANYELFNENNLQQFYLSMLYEKTGEKSKYDSIKKIIYCLDNSKIESVYLKIIQSMYADEKDSLKKYNQFATQFSNLSNPQKEQLKQFEVYANIGEFLAQSYNFSINLNE